MTSAVHAVGLGYTYPSGRPGVHGIDLRVEAGERIVVVGPNGSGKSTLLRLLATERPPSSGSLRLLGEPAARPAPELRRRIGYAPDRPVHLDALPAMLDAELFGRAAGLGPGEARERARRLMTRLGLGDDLHAPAGEYSMGMRRKLLLAGTLAPEPPLVLLDEPTLGLDPPSVDALVDLLGERTDRGAALVAALNDPAVAERLADRVVFLDEVGPGETARLELVAPDPYLPEAPPGVELSLTGTTLHARLPAGAAALPELLKSLLDRGIRVREMQLRPVDLRDVFRRLTGRSLDAEAPDSRPDPSSGGEA